MNEDWSKGVQLGDKILIPLPVQPDTTNPIMPAIFSSSSDLFFVAKSYDPEKDAKIKEFLGL